LECGDSSRRVTQRTAWGEDLIGDSRDANVTKPGEGLVRGEERFANIEEALLVEESTL
jgi:hypothetical protein